MLMVEEHRRPLPELLLQQWRCPKCGRILARLLLSAGSVLEIRCSSCHTVAVVQIRREEEGHG